MLFYFQWVECLKQLLFCKTSREPKKINSSIFVILDFLPFRTHVDFFNKFEFGGLLGQRVYYAKVRQKYHPGCPPPPPPPPPIKKDQFENKN